MTPTILTAEAARTANIEIVVEEGKYQQAVFDHIIAIRAGRRSGSACTKTRGEVAGSNAKPWRQKGTGRARAGEKRSPIWRGGGVVFGPRPRDYSLKINRKVAKLALRRAFSERVNNGDVILVEGFNVASGKTKAFVDSLASIAPGGKVLLIGSKFAPATLRAGRNVAGVQLKRASDVNTEHLLLFKKIIFTEDALPIFAQRMVIKK